MIKGSVLFFIFTAGHNHCKLTLDLFSFKCSEYWIYVPELYFLIYFGEFPKDDYPAISEAPREIGDALVLMAGAKSDRYGTLELELDDDGEIASFAGDAVRLGAKGPRNDMIYALFTEQERREKEARRERQLATQREREAQAQLKQVTAVHDCPSMDVTLPLPSITTVVV